MYIDHCMYTGWGVLCFFLGGGFFGEFEFLSLSLPKPLLLCFVIFSLKKSTSHTPPYRSIHFTSE